MHETHEPPAEWNGRLAAGFLGGSAILTQLVLMRELLVAFSGNELVLGILLGNWLLLTGLGTYFGKWTERLEHPLRLLAAGFLLLALLPLLDLFLVRALRDVVFTRGAAVGLTETILGSLVLLAPYCLLSGFLLTLACARARSDEGPGWVYFADSLGSIAGGLAFSFLILRAFGHFRILYLQSFLGLAFAGFLAWRLRRRTLLAVASAVALGVLALSVKGDLDHLSTQLQFAGQKLVFEANSPYGRLTVTELEGQYTALENGVPLFSTNDLERVEESVHYAMAQRPEARRVLILGGGVSGTAKEVLKYSVDEVQDVELDPLVIAIGQRYFPRNLADPRIHVANTDGRLFIRQARERYDVILVGLPDPSTCQLNRFRTLEFFAECKEILAQGGVLSFSLGQYENYMSPQLARRLDVQYRTLAQVFRNVLIIPGARVCFLASDEPLSLEIPERLEAKGIRTRIVGRGWLREMLKPDRMADIQRAIAEPAPLNRDFSPVLYYLEIRQWMAMFPARVGLLAALLLLGLTGYFSRIRAVPFVLFTAGFAASALEVVLLLGFQVLYGSVYQQMGLIVTLFMAGLALGSFAMIRMRWERRGLSLLAFAIAIYGLLLPFALQGLGRWTQPLIGQAAIALLTLVLASLVGMQFPLAAHVDDKGGTGTAAQLFTADFVGASLGALLVGALLIPLLGVGAVCIMTAALNVMGGVVLAGHA